MASSNTNIRGAKKGASKKVTKKVRPASKSTTRPASAGYTGPASPIKKRRKAARKVVKGFKASSTPKKKS